MSQAVGLWHRTHINILLMPVARCWGEILNWILYPALRAARGSCILYGYSFLCLAMRPRLLSFRLVFGIPPIPGRAQSAVAPTCTPATEKQLWSSTTSLVQLKEKERPAKPFPPLFTLPESSAQGHLYNGQTFFTIKTCKSCPPPPTPLLMLLRLDM